MNRLEQSEIENPADLGGSFTLPGTSITLNRMGYGAMQLAGPQVGDRRAIWTLPSRFCEKRLRRREPYRYERLLRSACDESDHQTGASSLSGWTW